MRIYLEGDVEGDVARHLHSFEQLLAVTNVTYGEVVGAPLQLQGVVAVGIGHGSNSCTLYLYGGSRQGFTSLLVGDLPFYVICQGYHRRKRKQQHEEEDFP